MYKADGIDLTRSEYLLLRNPIADKSNDDKFLADANSDTYMEDVFKALERYGLISIIRDRFGLTESIYVEHYAYDWLISYRASIGRDLRSAATGAIAGGIASLAVVAADGAIVYVRPGYLEEKLNAKRSSRHE